MKTTISQIANVQAGVFALPNKEGKIIYLQAKHFNEAGVLDQVLYPELNLSEKNERFLLLDGDILFAAKGSRNFAVVYRDTFGIAVASPTFLVARISSFYRTAILPDYLAWFINNPQNLDKLKSAATGSSIKAISTGVFKDLEITFPSVKRQQIILKIYELCTKEIKLRLRLESLRETLIQNLLLQAAKQ